MVVGFLWGKGFCLTLVSTPVLIFSSWVQLSDSTSARGRSEELLLQLFPFKRDLRRRRGMFGR